MEGTHTMPETIGPAPAPAPAVPPTPPVPLQALLAREDLALRRIAGPADPGIVIHGAHTSEMADPSPYLLGGELLLTAGVHIPEGAGRGPGEYFADYVSRIVAGGGAALGFGVAPVHDTVPPALVAACERQGLPLLEVPPHTTFSAVARAVWQLMAQARLAELRRVTEAQQSLAAAAARPDPIPSVLRQLSQRLSGRAVLYGPDGTEVAGAGRIPAEGGAGTAPGAPADARRTGQATPVERPGTEAHARRGGQEAPVERLRPEGAVRTGRAAPEADLAAGPQTAVEGARTTVEGARTAAESPRGHRDAADSVATALAALADVVRPAPRATAPPPGPTPPAPHAGRTATPPSGTPRAARSTPPPSGAPASPSAPPARPHPASATDTHGGVHLAVYALGAGEGFVLGVASRRREAGDHTIASVAAVLLALLTGEHHSGAGAARSSALVRLLLGAPPEEVAPLLGAGRRLVVHARPEAHPPDPVAASALGAALGSPLVDLAGEVVRVLVPADRVPQPQPGWTLGVSAPAEPREWPAADTQAARALARARATRAPLLRHAARPALADLVPAADAETHARTLLAPLAGQPALAETLRAWLSLHGSWDRTAVALGVHRNTVRQRVARCAALLDTDLDDPDVRMELWFALRRG
ncbi:helix-turn-helix domain-containing protein [Streptomyces eurythermus]|uniref:PucR family transcriptional regulator n=1 Tax=Streptomyces eurythermus TaxID=42237 RepID=UPI003683410C